MEISYNQPSIQIQMDEESQGLPKEIIITAHPNHDNPNMWVYTLNRTEEQ